MLKHPGIDQLLHALAEPSRRAIVEQLGKGPAAVSDLAAPLRITVAAALQHVQMLERARLVRSEKRGRVRHCELDAKGFTELERWIGARKAQWARRLDRLAALLDDA